MLHLGDPTFCPAMTQLNHVQYYLHGNVVHLRLGMNAIYTAF